MLSPMAGPGRSILALPHAGLRAWLPALLLALGGVASAQAPPAPEGEAEFIIFVRAARVGTERVTVARTAEGWAIRSAGRFEAPINLTLRKAEAIYDAGWRPVQVSMDGSFRERPISLSTRFDGTTATSRFTSPQTGEPAEKQDRVAADTLALPNNFFGAYAALAVRLLALASGAEVRVYVAPQAEIAIVLDAVEEERIETASRSFAVRRHRITFKNPGGDLAGELVAETDGRLVRISLPSAGLDVVRWDVATVAARRQTFHREGDEPVKVPAAGFALAATISKPAGAAPGRLPAVVLVPGSGQVDRDEFVAGIPIFGQISAALADAGFLVVRYDKRGVGQSGGRLESATLSDYAEDARAIVAFLDRRKDVDPKRIALVGHSEGAWAAFVAASRDDRVARVVAVAGPGLTGAQLVLEQQRHLLSQLNLSDAERKERIDLQMKIQAAVLGGGTWEGVPDDLRKQADTPWFQSFLAFDPARVVKSVHQPILIIEAELDRQVPPPHGERLLTLAKARKKSPRSQLVTVPGINHLLVPAKTGEVSEYGTLGDVSVSPAVVEAIVGFLTK
jgi:pimeloyl-ACP methyl ester carboxylesterase